MEFLIGVIIGGTIGAVIMAFIIGATNGGKK